MENKVFVKSYDSPKINKKEILRYLRAEENPDVNSLIDSCIAEAEADLAYRLCYARLPISIDGDELELGFASVRSHSLALCLDGCDEIVLMCATIGVGLDRLIKKYSLLQPSRGVVLQALGSERVEALCDAFCDELKVELGKEMATARPRFSPGYGDLSLDVQRDVFLFLDPAKRIGVSLGKDLFMTPSKSVTAIIGIKKTKQVFCLRCLE